MFEVTDDALDVMVLSFSILASRPKPCSKQLCMVSLLDGVGRSLRLYIPGMFPQKSRGLAAALTCLAFATTGLLRR